MKEVHEAKTKGKRGPKKKKEKQVKKEEKEEEVKVPTIDTEENCVDCSRTFGRLFRLTEVFGRIDLKVCPSCGLEKKVIKTEKIEKMKEDKTEENIEMESAAAAADAETKNSATMELIKTAKTNESTNICYQLNCNFLVIACNPK